ncbi:SapC family protein [Halomonas sp. HNIBRBA4712]|uniref:SapC family protein n=1 Tax=Halomonas sp. HNIBRBA4712 TaxID=3373087 RepID=UPI0037457EBE
MSHYVPLQASKHYQAGFAPTGYEFALEQPVVPVVVEELPELVATMPTGFIRRNSGTYELIGLQALEGGKNVFVHTNGRWIGGYRPAMYRAYPFKVMNDTQAQRWVLCIDEAAPGFRTLAQSGDTSFFDAEKKPTEQMKKTLTFLQNLENARQVTDRLVSHLDEAGLIVPWQIKLASGDQQGRMVEGLYHIHEAALKSLSGDRLAGLAESGALALAYTQLLSEHRLSVLQKLYNLRQKALDADEKVDLEKLFDNNEDDISFNFDS